MATWMMIVLAPLVLVGPALVVTGALVFKRERGLGITLLVIGGVVLMIAAAIVGLAALELSTLPD